MAKPVLRAGYGVFYETIIGNIPGNVMLPPRSFRISLILSRAGPTPLLLLDSPSSPLRSKSYAPPTRSTTTFCCSVAASPDAVGNRLRGHLRNEAAALPSDEPGLHHPTAN